MPALKLSAHQAKVYAALGASPSLGELRDATGLTNRQIHQALAGLRKKGINILTGCYRVTLLDPVTKKAVI